MIPVAGRWRGTESTLTITNVADGPASVQITFIPASPVTVSPLLLTVEPSRTAVVDVGRVVLRNADAVGGLLLRSDEAIKAQVQLFDRTAQRAGEGVFRAVAASDSIGVGESTFIDVPALGEGGLRLFIVETRGLPLYFSVSIVNSAARPATARRYYISGGRQSTQALEAHLTIDRSKRFTLELHGINGSGRIVAAAAAVRPDKSIEAFGMTRRRAPGHRMPSSEIAAYAILAAAIAAGALKWRLPPRGSRA